MFRRALFHQLKSEAHIVKDNERLTHNRNRANPTYTLLANGFRVLSHAYTNRIGLCVLASESILALQAWGDRPDFRPGTGASGLEVTEDVDQI
jgi:hypothetical protein